jgi:hypothetical protein
LRFEEAGTMRNVDAKAADAAARAEAAALAGVWFEDAAEASADLGSLHYPASLVGMQFGELTVYRASAIRGRWDCRCSCGGEKEVARRDLLGGRTRSCGCLALRRSSTIDLRGKQFGKLRVLRKAAPATEGQSDLGAFWLARCVCGEEVVVRSNHLRSGHTTSCGCSKRSAQFRPGGLSLGEEIIRDAVLADLLAHEACIDGTSIELRGGVRVSQKATRVRVARLLGTAANRAVRVRAGKVFRAVVAALPQAGTV